MSCSSITASACSSAPSTPIEETRNTVSPSTERGRKTRIELSLGDHRTGPIGSIGDAMSLVFLATILPVAFVAIRYIGETRDLDMAAYDEAMLL